MDGFPQCCLTYINLDLTGQLVKFFCAGLKSGFHVAKMFTRIVIAALFCLQAASLTQAAVKLPDLVTPCSLKDPKLDDCLTTQGTTLVPQLVKGVKEWGVPPMDPLFVPLMQLQKSGGGSIGLSINITNSSQYGWKDMQIKSIKFNAKDYKFDVKWVFPVYKMIGSSETSGRFLLLPIYGKGFANLTFVDADIEMTVQCRPEEKNGNTYLKIKDLTVSTQPKKIIHRIDNLFNNKQLSDTMNNFLNQNDQEAFRELKQNIDDIFAGIASSILTRMFDMIPLKEMFKDVA